MVIVPPFLSPGSFGRSSRRLHAYLAANLLRSGTPGLRARRVIASVSAATTASARPATPAPMAASAQTKPAGLTTLTTVIGARAMGCCKGTCFGPSRSISRLEAVQVAEADED